MQPRIPLPPEFTTGPFDIHAAHRAGLGETRLRGPDLKRPLRGIRSPSPLAFELEQVARAYQERMPAHGFFSSITAARLVGVPLPSRHENATELHVAVPTPHRCPVGKGIIGHTIAADDAEVQLLRGLRVSSYERTWFDLGSVLDVPDLIAATDFFIKREQPLTTLTDLAAALARFSGRRGRRSLRTALEYANDRSESRKESQLRYILVRAQLHGLVANLPITTSGGYHYRADLAFPAERVLVEYQSDYHGDIQQFRADMTRRARLEADGWLVVLVNADDLKNPEELAARIRRTVHSRAHRAAH